MNHEKGISSSDRDVRMQTVSGLGYVIAVEGVVKSLCGCVSWFSFVRCQKLWPGKS